MILHKALFSFLLFFTGYASAEILSIPENCLAQEVAPCLIKTSENQNLKSHSGQFILAATEDTIVKIIQFTSPFQFELLQGKVIIRSSTKKVIEFTLNDVRFATRVVFAQFNQERRLQVYDTMKFILSEYEQGLQKGQESVIRKAEFLAKRDMIRFLSEYFVNKKYLVVYLKSIEASWKKEFKVQTNDQTIALQRSIASIEKVEAEDKRQTAEEAEELKKVRSQFFYRTFYR